MKQQDVLKHPTNVLTAAQRQQFFDEGFLVACPSARCDGRIARAQPFDR
jgi:hypothetical protein